MKNIKTIGIYAYISPKLEIIGGLEAQIYHLSKELSKRGYNVIIHSLNYDNEDYFRSGVDNDNIGIVSIKDGINNLDKNYKASKYHSEDIIFAFGIRDGKIYKAASYTAEKLGIPLVSFVYFTKEESDWRSKFKTIDNIPNCDSSEEYQKEYMDNFRKICDEIINESNLVIVPTEYVRGQLVSCTDYKNYDKIKVCYHGIANSESMFNNNYKWLNEEPVFVHASRLKHPQSIDKGIYWTDHFADFSNSLINVFGNGDYKFKSKNIINHGLVRQDELFQFMSAKCKYSLIPSQMEAGCTIALESVMCNCLPIALNMAGLAEVMKMVGLEDYLVEPVKHKLGVPLFVYEPNDSDVVTVINTNVHKIMRDISNAQKIIREKFTIQKTTDKLLKILEGELLL